LTLVSLLFLVFAIVASTLVVVLRGLRLFRTARSFSRVAQPMLAGVMATTEELEAKADALPGAVERLTLAVERLQVSLARLAVLRDAAAEVKHSVDTVRGAVPRK